MRGQNNALLPASCNVVVSPLSPRPSVPAKVDLAWAIGPLFDQGFVELTAGTRVDVGPAELTVVLQAGDVSTEEGRKLAPAACPLALITHLVVQDVGLHLHLCSQEAEKRGKGYSSHRCMSPKTSYGEE